MTALVERLRHSILGRLHIGQLKPGDRLPSIRQIARDTRVDHRLVARAYDHLAEELLVEVRGRSGVFVMPSPTARAGVLAGRAHWISQILTEGWSRRLTLSEVSALVTRAAQHGLRCLCLETTMDHLVAFSSELATDLGFITHCERLTGELDLQADFIRELAANADVIVTTSFHAGLISKIIAGAKPVLTVSVNPAFRDEVQRRLQNDDVAVVVADPLFAVRIRQYAGDLPRGGENLRIYSVEEALRMELPPTTLYTRAARRELGLGEFHLLSGNVPFIAPESSAALCDYIVGQTLQDRGKEVEAIEGMTILPDTRLKPEIA